MRSRFRGCLLGLALGDALGAPYEGSLGLIDFDLNAILSLSKLRYTDDTIMALCIAKSLISKRKFDPSDIAENYLKWFLSGNLRGIGMTVYKALSNYAKSRNWKSCGIIDFWAAGNGVAMRVAPIALFDINASEEVLYEHVRLDGWITHKNELAISGAFTVALAIRAAIKGYRKEKLIDYVKSQLENFGILNRVYDALLKAIELYGKKTNEISAFKALGTTGYVVHTIGSAIYAFLIRDNFMDTISILIRAGGDTDTNAAVAGAIAGAYYGYENLPMNLLRRLENFENILEMADKLYDIVIH